MKKNAVLTLLTIAAFGAAMPIATHAQSTREAAPASSTITPVQDLEKLFNSLDTNHDGSISQAEFDHLSGAMAGIGSGQTGRAGEADSSAFRSSKLSQEDLHRVFSKLDRNNDGVISQTEFQSFNQVVAENGGKR